MSQDQALIDEIRSKNVGLSAFAVNAAFPVAERLFSMLMDCDDPDTVRKGLDSLVAITKMQEPKTPQVTLAPMNLIIDLSDNAVQERPKLPEPTADVFDITDAVDMLEARVEEMEVGPAAGPETPAAPAPAPAKPRRGRKPKNEVHA